MHRLLQPLELVARVKALLRHAGENSIQENISGELTFGDIVLNPSYRTATIAGSPLPPTPTEFDFLTYLITNSDKAVSREELLKVLWQIDWNSDTPATCQQTSKDLLLPSPVLLMV